MYRDMRVVGVEVVAWASEVTLEAVMRLAARHRPDGGREAETMSPLFGAP